MKGAVAASAAFAAGVYAQAANVSVSYSTVTIDECPSSVYESMITVTDGVTVTYCPECEGMTPPPASATPTGPGYTTVYTTTYMSYCPTGSTLTPVTYTVTETCDHPTPTWTPGPSHIPQGYTTGVITCEKCAETPMEVTITQPCDCEANEGTPMPKPKPQPSATTTMEECDDCDHGPSMPTPAPPGEECHDCPEGGHPPPSPPPSTSGTPPPPPGEECHDCPEGSQPPPPPPGPPGTSTEECHECSSMVTQISDGQVQAPTLLPESSASRVGGGPPPPGPPPPSGPGRPASPPAPYPTGTTVTHECHEPPCVAGPTSATGGSMPSPSGIKPPVYNAAAAMEARFGIFAYSLVALFVGLMAVGL